MNRIARTLVFAAAFAAGLAALPAAALSGSLYNDTGGAPTNSGSSDSNAAAISGSSNATIVADNTILSVDTTADTIDTTTNHGFSSGYGLTVTGGTLPTGITSGVLYYVNAVDANTLSFHNTMADAIAGTSKRDLTAAGSGTRTLNNRTVVLGGTPNLSSLPALIAVEATRPAVYLNSATNANLLVFWVLDSSDANDWLVVHATPTGLGAGSSWAIAVARPSCRPARTRSGPATR